MSPSISCQINALLPGMVLSVSPTLQEMIRALLGPILIHPFKPFWTAPDEDGVLDWSGEGVDDLIDYVTEQSCQGDSEGEGFHSTGGGNRSRSPLNYTPLVLLSCSPVRSDNTHSAHHSWKYIQGAGDDEENWCQGLSAELFWRNQDLILESDDPRQVTNLTTLSQL